MLGVPRNVAKLTAVKAIEALGLVGMANAVGEGVELVAMGDVSRRPQQSGKLAYACSRVLTESRGYWDLLAPTNLTATSVSILHILQRR
jgi:hypothetical protein